MPLKLKPDRLLFLVTLVLVFLGIVMVFSSSAVTSGEKLGNPNYFFIKQVIAATAGLMLMFILMRIDYHYFRAPAVVFGFLSAVFLLLVAVFFGQSAANTQRWIQLGGFSVQPSEIAKLAMIIFLAYFLELRKAQVNDIRGTLLPASVIVGLISVLVFLQPDLGTAITIIMVAFVLFFVSGLNLRWIGVLVLASLPVLYLAVMQSDYRRARVFAFLDPWSEPLKGGYQIIQSLISLGSGGFFGLGYMEGRQKLFFLPAAQTDFIYAVVGEELGIVGTLIVLVLFLLFAWRGLRSAMRAPDLFGFYLALGITAMVAVQAFINMSMVLGLMPTKGIPLPFLSYGGSSVLVMLASVGILLNVSQQGG